MLGPIDILASCTVRIVGYLRGSERSVGTGFLYHFGVTSGVVLVDDAPRLPALITNKHVVEGCDEIRLVISIAPMGAALGDDNQLVGRYQKYVTMFIDDRPTAFKPFMHPDVNIDLCAIGVGEILNQLQAEGLALTHQFLGLDTHPDYDTRKIMRALEPVVMVGYPRGIWDHLNNAPILRRGSTATHPNVRYENNPEFLIDAACFPGSSGSPVFLFEDGLIRNEHGYSPGTRIALLGVLYAGHLHTAEGHLEVRPIPHSFARVPIVTVPMNLGIVIQAAEIEVVGDVFRQHMLSGS